MYFPLLNNSRNYNIAVMGRKLFLGFLLLSVVASLSACDFPGSTKPVLKLGLLAPFEGEYRAEGYQQLYGVKLALQESNLSGGVAGYKFELVALNHDAQSEKAILQAQALVIDFAVIAVIGDGDDTLADAVAPVYQTAQLAVINPHEMTGALPANFADDYRALSGTDPDSQAAQAYLATQAFLSHVEKSVSQHGKPLNRIQFFVTQ